MKKEEKIVKNILFLAGSIEILVGLLHFAMPYYVFQSSGFMPLTGNEADYVMLLIFAVGILLISFGAVTILFASFLSSMAKFLYYYLIIKTVLWTIRVTLEIIYPINLEMFYVKPFTLVVLPGLIFELLLFIIATFLLKKILTKEAI